MAGSSPPPDVDHPPLPYVSGFVLQVKEHHPPPPFGPGGYSPPTYPYKMSAWIRTVTQTQQVLASPLQDTKWPSDTSPRSGVVTITKTISVGEDRGAQLVVCNVLIRGQKEHYTAAAKIYDPLYYPFTGIISNGPQNVVWLADADYSREAAAYRHLQTTKNLQKPGFAPEYYGSWTFDLALTHQGKVYKRSVRLVLIEHIAGPSILDLYKSNPREPNIEPNAFHYNEAYRLDVLAEIVEGVAKQVHSGLYQKDLSARNVMLVPGPPQTMPPLSVPRVALIDYNASVIFELTKQGRHPSQYLSLPMNPIDLYWESPPQELDSWVPIEWYDEGKEHYQQWLLTRFGGEHAGRFAPLQEKLEFYYNNQQR
ncbi:hypothetical protein F4859DRAFT_492479 [Xylaria cf. heliscus]|nr:hypothetical protein F4859DRAFT_492479 [Xylaria cf. heliscus]